ncbi:sigma-70 family RNA polymerase sigma factor [Microbacterium sp. M3]|uniref:Sigma-70 family RNA polymerase sigma factor n=1 Tax=Microbacterium arthrosphaerae TaxID=792652 RepID=A0ABU4GVW0_9MICO|nr:MULTISPECIES: sigma-70 family RNA polymerase sigma factor [Microbacterium]MDW4571208.1 sigma-70 family RNA polymerase sigma factor [Microbacterium arthrosphaerae]MDW7605063.1 sigma-70 family RNA polymerase sigma factor [Microbacterium sp. M3]
MPHDSVERRDTAESRDAVRLAALYDAHAAPVWRYVVHLTGDRAGADDVVQETLLRAWRTPRILEQDPSTTRSWMFTVARHLVIDEVRSARRRREIGVAEVPERSVPDATDALFEAILVEEALAALTVEHRSVVIHAYYRGLSVAEMADALDIPEGTVKSRLHYGLRALRLALQERGVTR